MTTLMIKDLEISKELTGKDLSAVRGGLNFGIQGGQQVSQFGLLNFASPVTAVNTPILVQTDTAVNINLANILGSIAAVGQA
jgi:hypothetical protein